MGEGLTENEAIRELNISDNKISDAGFRSFIPLFKNNNSMESFDCSVNFITDDTAIDFFKNLKYNHVLKRLNFYDNQLKNGMGTIILGILESNKTLLNINLMYNRIQKKTIEEINKTLKLNKEKQKAKFMPNLIRDIKSLQFNPEVFSFFTKSISKKKSLQESLYKKVKQDDRHFTLMLNKENNKINSKMQEMKNIQDEIEKYQNITKELREKEEAEQKIAWEEMEKYENKIEEEAKALRGIKGENIFVEAEYKSTKKDLENVVAETKTKLKKSADKLGISTYYVKSLKDRIKNRSLHYKNLFNQSMLVKIKAKEDNNKKIKRQNTKKVQNKNKQSITEHNSGVTTNVSGDEYFGTIASGTNESNNGNDNMKNKKNSNTIK